MTSPTYRVTLLMTLEIIMDRRQRRKQLAAKKKKGKDAIRRQKRKDATSQRKTAIKVKKTWENEVVAAFVRLGWAKREVRSHMKYISSLPTAASVAIRSISPNAYVKSIVNELLEQGNVAQ